jgi:hypothetical protein
MNNCRIDSTGLRPGEVRTCQFTAAADGGYQFFAGFASQGYPSQLNPNQAVVTVTRGENVTTYHPAVSPGPDCSGDAVRRGDLVRIEWQQGSGDADQTGYIAAGWRWSCGAPGGPP